MAITDKLKKIVKSGEKELEGKKQVAVLANVSDKRKGSKNVESCHYFVLERPHITEKSSMMAQLNRYVFKVAKNTNKIEIKKAIESIYGVKVEDVNIANMPGKKIRLGRSNEGRKAGFKKAIVSLKEGDKIDIGV